MKTSELRYLKLRDLYTLCRLSEGVKLCDIAKELNICASAMSSVISVREHQLGQSLLVRDGRRLKLTIYGEDLAKRSKSALEAFGIFEKGDYDGC